MPHPPPLKQHPLRASLHNEVHARPPEAMEGPQVISRIVMLCDEQQRQASTTHLADLLRDHHLPQPDAHATHLRLDVGGFRIRWELHTEFVTWTFVRVQPDAGLDPRAPATAIEVVPRDWLAALPGSVLASLHLWILPSGGHEVDRQVRTMLQEETLVASTVAEGGGELYTDFAIHADGFSRMLLLTDQIAPRRLGRLVQRLLEIETYRMAALLGLPAARDVSAVLATAERELAELAEAIRTATRRDEPLLLNHLTRLAGQVESQHAKTHSRLSASAAYFELVDRRIEDIAESRLAGMQTMREFMDRRLTPARSTCEWAARRQDALSQRVSRISSLLRTRVEIEQQQSSQELLTAMNQRQAMQLKLQSTVEGLSVAAITYYMVGLVSYVAKAGHAIGWPFSAETSAAVAIPIVALVVWLMMRRLHRELDASLAERDRS
ncbi:MAG: DUF3422 domain-containing protein [Burkholderiaceae bacterium]